MKIQNRFIMPIRPRPPRQRVNDPSRIGANATAQEEGNPAWQSNAKVGSRELVENNRAAYTWKNGVKGGLQESDIQALPIMGSRGDFNKRPIAKVIDSNTIEYKHPDSIKYRYKSIKATNGALKRNNWVIYVQTAILSMPDGWKRPKYPVAISDIILQGMYYSQIDTPDGLKDAPIHPEVYSMFLSLSSKTIIKIKIEIEASLDANENWFTIERDTIMNDWKKFCQENGRDPTKGLQNWDRYGDHSKDLEDFMRHRKEMLKKGFVNPSQREIADQDQPALMPGASSQRQRNTPIQRNSPPQTPLERQELPIPPQTPRPPQQEPPPLRIIVETPESSSPSPFRVVQGQDSIGGEFDGGFDAGPDNTPINETRVTPHSTSSVKITLRERMDTSARRNLFGEVPPVDPVTIFQEKRMFLKNTPHIFATLQAPGYNLAAKRMFLSTKNYLPPLNNPREAFNKIDFQATPEFIEDICGNLILYLISVDRIEPDNYPKFLSVRSLNAANRITVEDLNFDKIYLMHMVEQKFILVDISNYWSAYINDDFNTVKIKMYKLSPDENADFREMENEITTILGKIKDLVPSFASSDLTIKRIRPPITQNTYPLILPMFFYQYLEKVKKMIFEPQYFAFFKCNLLEIVLPGQGERIYPNSKTFLLTHLCFQTVIMQPEVEQPIVVEVPQAQTEQPIVVEANSKKRKKKETKKKSNQVLEVPIPEVEEEPPRRKQKVSEVLAAEVPPRKSERVRTQKNQYSPSPLKKSKKVTQQQTATRTITEPSRYRK